MEDPDPDPLGSFLVSPKLPIPNPPKSAPPSILLAQQTQDPRPPSPDLPADGSLSMAHHGNEEIEAVRPSSNGDPSTPACLTQLPPETQKLLQPSIHQSPPAQSTTQPGSPTSIDPELQEKARALLPDLAEDLERLKKQRAATEGEQSKLAINPSSAAPEHATTSVTGQQPQSMVRGAIVGTVNEEELLRSRIPASQKGKQMDCSESSKDAQRQTGDQGKQAYAEATTKKMTVATAQSSSKKEHQINFHVCEEGWEPAKTSRKRRDADKETRVIQSPNPLNGSDFFKSKMDGKCYNCFSPNHIARLCKNRHRCWKCFHSGHRAFECKAPGSESLQKHRESHQLKKAASHKTPPPPPPPPPPVTDRRSYAEVVRGTTAMAARYPGDPRGRPARAFCSVTATGPIRRRRDDIIHHAAVCWLNTYNHDTEPHHLGEAIRDKLHLRHDDFQVVKHYPEKFLIIFRDPVNRQRLLDRGGFIVSGRDFRFAPWSERRNAKNTTWEFRVKVRIEGVPVHCWAEEVAAMALGKSCAIHYLEERTRRRDYTRTFDLWAWCCNPTDIPKEVTLTVTEPDRELPLLQAPPQYDAPTGLKRGHVYNLRNHLEVVDDLSFLDGRGRTGAPRNRKPHRDMIWSYGVPDSVGEDLNGRYAAHRGRDIGRPHRRDDDDYDNDRSRYRHYRRHRSVSSWARNARCRNGAEDCTRRRSGRDSPPKRNRVYSSTAAMVWRKKEVREGQGKKKKRVTFADPIATELKAPKPTIKDDSIQLIMEGVNQKDTLQVETGAVVDKHNDANGAEPAQPNLNMEDGLGKLAVILEEESGVQELQRVGVNILLEKTSHMTHLPKPLTKPAMEAMGALIEHGEKLGKKATKTKVAGNKTA